MKKYLLTLIVTMLTAIGAWAQGTTPASLTLCEGEEAYVVPNWEQGDGWANYTFLYDDETTSTVVEAEKWPDWPHQNEILVKAIGAGTVTVYVTNASTNETLSFGVTVIGLSEDTNVSISIEEIDGKEYYVVNVPVAGAFGAISDKPAVILKNGATLEGLRNAANVKVTGVLANSDVAELAHFICDVDTHNDQDAEGNHINICKTLDMGAATMSEALVLKADGSWDFQSWFVPDAVTTQSSILYFLESLTLPKPAANNTVIPTGMYNIWNVNATLFKSLAIPEGWTEIGDHAFADNSGNGLKGLADFQLANSIETIGEYAFANIAVTSLKMPTSLVELKAYAFAYCANLENLTFNDDLARIGAHAFDGLMCKTLYMPKNIKRIDAGAFDVKNGKLQDIYFTGHAPEFVHTDAFYGGTQMCNNTVDDEGLPAQGPGPSITRYEYNDNGVLACILHYPHDFQSEYIDETRVYKMIADNETYSKGFNVYTPENWDDTFISTVKEKATTKEAKDAVSLSQDLGVKDKTYGKAFVWPSQSQMATGYAIAQAGYKWNADPFDLDQYDPTATYENGGIDKRGLYQFIVGMGNAPDDPHEWKFKFQQDLWYTISLPFDMTPAEIRKVFGDKTQVCRFSEVVRETPAEGTKVLKLIFKNSVMQEGDGRKEDIVYYYDEVGGISDTKVEKAGIRHHHPYMIKPSGEVDEDDATIKYNPATGERVFTGYKSVPGTLEEEAVKADDPYGPDGLFYYFRPNMMQTAIKKNSYVLTADKNDSKIHKFIFYKGKKNTATNLYEDGGTQVANSCYVQLNHGESDLAAFFAETVYTGQSKSFFGIDGDDDSATEIEKVVIVCGDDIDEDAKVYTIGGQLVNGSTLPAGLYIKNGKKFIVK